MELLMYSATLLPGLQKGVELDAVETMAFKIIGISVMKMSLWDSHFHIVDTSVVSMLSTTSFLVLHPLLFPCFVPPNQPPGFLQSSHGPPSTLFW